MNPSMGAVLFNTKDLESLVSGLRVLSINAHHPPQKTLSNYILANANKTKTTQNFFTGKPLGITFAITQNSRALLEKALDSLWPLVSGTEGTLIVLQSNMRRQYTATWSDTAVIEESGGYMKFTLVFTLSDQYGYDTDYTLLLDQSNITTQPQTITMADVDGSAEFQAPLIQLWLSVATGASSTLVISNPANTQSVSITKVFAVDDFIEIDSKNKTVKVNGIAVDFVGMIPEWQPKSIVGTGQSKITIADGLTTRKWRMRVTQFRRWV